MAQVFVSPGVYTKEIEEAFVPAGAGAIGAALVGLTDKGPAFTPTTVGNFGEFREKFGSLNTKKYMPYAAKSYLRNGDSLTVVRVLGRSTASVGAAALLAFPPSETTVGETVSALSASNTVLGVLRFRSATSELTMSGSPSDFSISAADGTVVNGLSMNKADATYIKKVLGTDPVEAKSGDQLTGLYVDAVYDFEFASITGTVSAVTNSGFVTIVDNGSTEITGGFANASTPMITSQNYNGSVYNLFKIHSLSHGDSSNSEIKVSITQVDLGASSFPSFTVLVRSFGDEDKSPSILENFSDVNLDPSSKQFIGRVIGDRRASYDLSQDPPEILYDGDYPNRSSFIRVQVEDGYPEGARPCGFTGVSRIGPIPIIPELTTKTDQLNTRNEVDSNVFMGIDFSVQGNIDRIKSTTTSASAGTTADAGVIFVATGADSTIAVTGYTVVDMTGASSGNYGATNKIRFTVPLYGGQDGLDPRVSQLVSSNDGTLSADYDKALKTLANPDEVDFNLIATPDAWSSSVGNIPDRMVDMVANRGDAFSIVDIAPGTATGSGLSMTIAQAQDEADKYDTNYAATYYPWIRINDVDSDKLIWVPPSVEVMGAYAFNDRVAQPWYAPAGFNRGGLESVTEARRRLTQSQRDDLYNKNVNPIGTFAGQGVVLFGQKTLQKKSGPLDRVSTRRMMLTVRKTIASFSKAFTFEPNDVSSRTRLLQIINSYLQTVQQQQGLTEFRAVLDETTTTPDLIDRNTMKGKIFIKPTSAAEIILLDFAVTRQGAIFEE